MSVKEVACVALPTPYGLYKARAFESASGFIYLAMVRGDLGQGPVLARVHSECLTGDVFGSLRCDCGIQLHAALKAIAAAGRGVLVYATGHEGRGIGLIKKLRAYVEQDAGYDTVDANLHLGLPVDSRTYDDAATVLRELGIRRVKLMSNNPRKIEGLMSNGIAVDEVVPLPVAPHERSSRYLSTKRGRMGHFNSLAAPDAIPSKSAIDVRALIDEVRPKDNRPYVVLKYAQSLDGRIATSNGDARWISGLPERELSHAMRAHCDAVLVGVGTVLVDDPLLTVRLVAGWSPIRVVLDSKLRIPMSARVLNDDAVSIVVTTNRSSATRRQELRDIGVNVVVVPDVDGRVDLMSALHSLRNMGISSLLVEGGAEVITSLLSSRSLVDRMVVAIAPKLLGRGTESVGDLGITDVPLGIPLNSASVHVIGDDLLVAASLNGTGNGNGLREIGDEAVKEIGRQLAARRR